MSTRYEYVHRAGYGRHDHMADEIIARAARRLGASGADRYIAQAVGFASHPVPMDKVSVSLPSGPGVRERMVEALRAARREVSCSDTQISIVCIRTRRVRDDYGRIERLREERRGRDWVVVDRARDEEAEAAEALLAERDR